ncbi:MAG: hypothetical protein DI551_06945 [Micavibrio aeruginosavorus]|uniref:Succinylglutamate desuccinylase/Aspartoacylase catalytic domain-containing protein n=1 Tax=Micavibrio aeruginosavorus TaxID=349221 RepID=A0A2W5MXR4_9BACT|nr:MAG: hypothetical protein DI551_06945 [Micavibrio aeruginosavorus]
MKSRVYSDLDFDRDGKHSGHLILPYQTNQSAYGNIFTPIQVIKNLEGPTLLLTAGVHGDEYEGQIALRQFFSKIKSKDIKGRIIIMPAVNYHAVKAGTRLSPLDGMNMHGAFPGSASSKNPTEELAYYIETEIMPMTDYMIDLHSGGLSLDYLPFCSIRLTNNDDLDRRGMDLLRAFNASLSMVWRQANGRMLSSAAARNNVVSLGGEFGGASTYSHDSEKIIEKGIRNVLDYLGMTHRNWKPACSKTNIFEVSGVRSYVYSRLSGIFETNISLGKSVKKNDLCGYVHPLEGDTGRKVHKFQEDGIVVCKRHLSLVSQGDCLAHTAILSKITL